MPDEDSAAVQERFEVFEDDLKPKNGVAQVLVLRAAMLSVRMERCVRHEAAELTLDMLQADATEADYRADEFATLIGSIAEDPSGVVRKLERSPEGIDWMIRSWEALKSDLLNRNFPRWSLKHGERAEQLTGHTPVAFGRSRIVTLSYAIDGNLHMLDDSDWPDLPTPERRQAARGELAVIVDTEVARLRRAREGLDLKSIALEHAGASARALFGTSKQAILARKYEAAAERGFYQALNRIEVLNASTETEAEAEAEATADESAEPLDGTHEQVESSDESGSFFPEPAAEKARTVETRRTAPIEPVGTRRRFERAPARGRLADLQPAQGHLSAKK